MRIIGITKIIQGDYVITFQYKGESVLSFATILLLNFILPNFLARRGFAEARRYRKYAAELDIVIRQWRKREERAARGFSRVSRTV